VLEPLGEALELSGDVAGAEQIVAARQLLAGSTNPALAGVLASERARLLLLPARSRA
jgi:hypothetical protein